MSITRALETSIQAVSPFTFASAAAAAASSAIFLTSAGSAGLPASACARATAGQSSSASASHASKGEECKRFNNGPSRIRTRSALPGLAPTAQLPEDAGVGTNLWAEDLRPSVLTRGDQFVGWRKQVVRRQ